MSIFPYTINKYLSLRSTKGEIGRFFWDSRRFGSQPDQDKNAVLKKV